MIFSKVSSFEEEIELKVALIAPMTGENSAVGVSLKRGVEVYLDEINRAGGIHGKKVVLDVFDDYNDPLRAHDLAIDVVEQGKAIAVIGHASDACSLTAGRVYKKYGIPAITPSATGYNITNNNDWYFRTIFSDNMQGAFLANYCNRVFGIKDIDMLFEESGYGLFLAGSFKKESDKLGIDVINEWNLAMSDEAAFSKRLDEIVAQIKAEGQERFIFLSSSSEMGARVVRALKDAGLKNRIIASDKMAEPAFTKMLAEAPREKLSPGYYSNGIIVATPLIYDSANEFAQTFRSDYVTKFKSDPDWAAAYSYDAIRLILHGAKEKDISGEPVNIRNDRKLIRDYLVSLKDMEYSLPGVTGPNFFNGQGDSIKPISMGTYRSQRIVSSLSQLQIVPDVNEFRNLEQVLETGEIINLENQYFYQTQVVYTGMELLDIHEVKMDEMYSEMEFYLWFRFRGEFDAKNLEFLNAKEAVVISDPVEEKLEGELKYQLYKIIGKFKLNFTDQGNFDEELLGLSFRHKTMSRNKLIFVVDVIGMGIVGSNQLTDRLTHVSNWLESTTNLSVARAEAFQSAVNFPTLGNLEYLNSQNQGVNYSQFNYVLYLKENQLTLRHRISEETAYFLLDLSLIMIVIYAFSDRIPIVRSFPRIIWVLQASCDLMLLLSTEILLINFLITKNVSSFNLEMLVLFFDILWWVIPAINLNTTLKIFVWKPIEKSTGNEIPGLLISTVSFIIIALASFGVLAFVFDMKVTGLLATSGMLAAIIGLALQMNLSNIISGITISLEKPFKIGDWVKIGDLEGKVLETNWRTTRLETRDESVMCVPNSVVSDSHIHNYHYPDDLFLLDLQVQIDLTHRPERVEKILLDAVLDIENILKEPAPSIDIAIGPWSVNYTITFAVRDYERRDEYLTLAWKYVWNHLYRAGISLASERQQIEMVKRPPVIRDGLCDSTTLIMDIDIFSPFKRDEVLALLEKVKTRSYKSRETIIRQGDDGDSLFIILEGTVEIWIQIAEGRDLEVARMGPGKFFGEMSLLTGEARTATVISTTNSRLIEITKDDFAPLVASYPTFAEELSKILIQRKQANQASSEGANPGANDQAARHLINQIRGFFA